MHTTTMNRTTRRTAILASLGALLLLTGCSPTHLHLVPFTLPALSGPDRVGTVVLHVPAGVAGGRETMAQLWYPTRAAAPGAESGQPWVEPQVARALAAPTAELLGLDTSSIPDLSTVHTHAQVSAPALGTRLPVVVFSPGLGGTRSTSTTIAEQLASNGVAVLAVDHPGDSAAVVLPGGRVVEDTLSARIAADADDRDRLARLSEQAVADRAADLGNALDALTVMNTGGAQTGADALPKGFAGRFDLSGVVAIGHSLGGAAALEWAAHDDRISGVVDLDGTPWGSVVHDGARVPTLVITSDDTSVESDPALAALLSASGGTARQTAIAGSRHLAFTDLLWLSPQLDGHGADAIGTIDPVVFQRTLDSMLIAFVHENAAG